MPFQVIPVPFDMCAMSKLITDAQVMNAFLSVESGPGGNNPEPYVILRDKAVLGGQDAMIARSFRPGWIVMFQIGGHAAAIPIAWAVVEDITALEGDLRKLFEWSEVTIETRRTIFSEVDTSEPIGVQTSTTKIATSVLNIFAIRTGNFEGSWAADNRDVPVAFVTTPLDTLDDDPRDKKL